MLRLQAWSSNLIDLRRFLVSCPGDANVYPESTESHPLAQYHPAKMSVFFFGFFFVYLFSHPIRVF